MYHIQVAHGLRLLFPAMIVLALPACSRPLSLVHQGEPFGTVSIRSDDRVQLNLLAVDGQSVAKQLVKRPEQPVKMSPGRHSLQILFRFRSAEGQRPADQVWATAETRSMSIFVQEGMHHVVGTDYRPEHARLAVMAIELISGKR